MKKIRALSTAFMVACPLCFEVCASSAPALGDHLKQSATANTSHAQSQISLEEYARLQAYAKQLEQENERLRSTVAVKQSPLIHAQYYWGEH